MSEELVDYKNNNKIRWTGMEGMIAAHLDAGDEKVKAALVEIITGENNVAFINTGIIRGIFKSNGTDLHKLLGQLLVAARLQEGVRQAICENMDCGTMAAFQTLFDVIEENDLLRYSAVRRAVATWIGILDPDHLVRSSNKTFHLMSEVVHDKEKSYELIDSEDAMSILIGLWGIGTYEIKDALGTMEQIVNHGSIQQKRVAAFYNQCLENKKFQQTFANKVIESPNLDIELAAGIFDTYLSDYQGEAIAALGNRNSHIGEIRPVDLNHWHMDENTARKHIDILFGLLQKMEHKKYQFNPYVFPWYFTNLTRSNVIVRICTLANGLQDEALMDQLAEQIPDLDSQDNVLKQLTSA